jgi:hypothetical protein
VAEELKKHTARATIFSMVLINGGFGGVGVVNVGLQAFMTFLIEFINSYCILYGNRPYYEIFKN